MNKPVQILLLFALLPMVGMAREETLEERKQRIVRKYLRENMTITQSDMYVPSDLPSEDEEIINSEKFQGVDIGIEREEGSPSQIIRPPQQRPMPVPRADSNWLLDNSDEIDDPYADPYADPFSSGAMDSGSPWDTYSGTESPQKDKRSDPYRYDPNQRQDENQAMTDGQQRSGFGSSSGFSGRADSFGQQQRERSTYSSGLDLQKRNRTYGSDPSEGLLTSPYPQLDASSSKDAERTQGFQPYKSPYDTQREKRSQQWGAQPEQKQPDYQRPDYQQQWKERNKTWDPTQDDAYTSEMMKQNKR